MRLLKLYLCAVLSLGIVLGNVPSLYADAGSDAILKLLIKKGLVTKSEVEEIKSEIAKDAPKKDKGFFSTKGVKVDVKGGAEIEFVDIESDDTGVAFDTATSSPDDSENPRLQVDKVTLRFTVQSEDETVGFSSELEFDEPGNTAFFDDAYVFLKGVEVGETTNFVKVGLMSRYWEPKKVFESYPLGGFAWNEDEEYYALYGGEVTDGWLYWRSEVAMPNEINDKAPTENGQFELLHDNRRSSSTGEIPNKYALGGGVGIKVNTADWETNLGKFDILGFYRNGQLTDDDVSFLRGLSGVSSTETNDDYLRAGVNVDYKLGKFGVRGQYMYTETSIVEAKGWHVEPYLKIPVGWRYLDSITPAVQISMLEVDLADTTADARTWDREKYTFGAVVKINKNLSWKNEYSVNEEDTGGDDVDNNEFISQLKFGF